MHPTALLHFERAMTVSPVSCWMEIHNDGWKERVLPKARVHQIFCSSHDDDNTMHMIEELDSFMEEIRRLKKAKTRPEIEEETEGASNCEMIPVSIDSDLNEASVPSSFDFTI